MLDWKWKEGSILYQCRAHTPTREIFQAVCDELGRYYQDRGLKYTKSSRRLKWRGERLRCEFGLCSSHSNIAGKWINLEVVSSIYALDTAGMERKGILSFRIRPKNFNVYQIAPEQFEDIAAYISSVLEMVKGWETREGLTKYIQEKAGQNWTYGNPNNLLYSARLS